MSIPVTIKPDQEVLVAMHQAGITRDQLVCALGMRYGTLSSKLSGRNPWKPGQRERAMEIIREHAAAIVRTAGHVHSTENAGLPGLNSTT